MKHITDTAMGEALRCTLDTLGWPGTIEVVCDHPAFLEVDSVLCITDTERGIGFCLFRYRNAWHAFYREGTYYQQYAMPVHTTYAACLLFAEMYADRRLQAVLHVLAPNREKEHDDANL